MAPIDHVDIHSGGQQLPDRRARRRQVSHRLTPDKAIANHDRAQDRLLSLKGMITRDAYLALAPDLRLRSLGNLDVVQPQFPQRLHRVAGRSARCRHSQARCLGNALHHRDRGAKQIRLCPNEFRAALCANELYFSGSQPAVAEQPPIGLRGRIPQCPPLRLEILANAGPGSRDDVSISGCGPLHPRQVYRFGLGQNLLGQTRDEPVKGLPIRRRKCAGIVKGRFGRRRLPEGTLRLMPALQHFGEVRGHLILPDAGRQTIAGTT